jgi:hypothetical protein
LSEVLMYMDFATVLWCYEGQKVPSMDEK